MENSISIKAVLSILKRYFLLIAAITLIVTAASGIASYFYMKPVYQAETQLLVNQKAAPNAVMEVNQVQTNLELISTYNVIIKSPVILKSVIKELDLNIDKKKLMEQITVSNNDESQVVVISVKDNNPETAVKIANTTANIFEREIVNIMNVDNVSILSPAELEAEPVPVSPKPLLNMGIAFIFGLLMSLGLTFLLHYLDNTIKTEEDAEQLLDAPVLGTIAVINSKKLKKDHHINRVKVRGETYEA